jgi:hypothetical protein
MVTVGGDNGGGEQWSLIIDNVDTDDNFDNCH